jgi:predicted DnaQ family exonuclease/DinG family helicase
MLKAVSDAFNYQNHLLVEAGTGTGKTIAYLIPALRFAQKNQRHVLISTKTISLQEQLLKDMRQLAGVVTSADETGGPVRYSVLKGRSNYLCLRRWLAFRRQRGLTQADVKAIVKIMVWLTESENGDMAEMRLTAEEESSIWPRISSTSDSCLGARCPNMQKNRCFYQRARRRAESSHVVVVNHALLISDLISGGQVLPKYDHLVVDEAHDLEDESTSQMTQIASSEGSAQLLNRCAVFHPQGKVEGLLEEVKHALARKKENTKQIAGIIRSAEMAQNKVQEASLALDEYFRNLSQFAESFGGDVGRYARRVRLTQSLRIQPAWSNIEVSWESLAGRLEELIGFLHSIRSDLADLDGVARQDDILADLDYHISQLGILESLSTAATVNPDQHCIYWLEEDGNGQISVCGAPLNVGSKLREDLFEKKSTVILTSATLTAQRSFEYIKQRLGLDYAEELILGSSFDYESNALLCLATDMPEPGQPGYQRWLEQSLVNLCTASQGRALVLFTSHTALRTTYKAVQPKLEERGILVLGQAIDGSRSRILNQFKHDHRTVLFGTASFWEGIDITGEALSLLVITKLPFSVPTDPVFAARAEEFDDGFEQYSVPQAILKFKQGFGRLIRSHQDRGAVVILDRRVLTRGYGSSFVDSLPACQMLQAPLAQLPGNVESWLNSCREIETA